MLKKLKHQKQAAEDSDSDKNMSCFSVHDESDDDITFDPYNAREPTMHRLGLGVNAASDSTTEGALMWISVS